jgi:hypothetical protein
MWPNFESFAITFKNQEDFNAFVEVKEGFDIVDISWSEFIVNFEDEEERQKAFSLLTGKTYGMQEQNLVFGE